MTKYLLITAILVVTSCTPSNPERWMEMEANACLPTAIAFRQGLQRQGIWSEVFRYNYRDGSNKVKGHAMVAYLYPSGQNQLYTYDYMGSYRTRAFTNNVTNVALQAHSLRSGSTNTFNAQWLK
jgi:hypothetical protein